MKAYVDKESCIGCGLCASVCPKVFFMDNDGRAKAIEEEIEDKQISYAQDTADSCPVSAIKVE